MVPGGIGLARMVTVVVVAVVAGPALGLTFGAASLWGGALRGGAPRDLVGAWAAEAMRRQDRSPDRQPVRESQIFGSPNAEIGGLHTAADLGLRTTAPPNRTIPGKEKACIVNAPHALGVMPF